MVGIVDRIVSAVAAVVSAWILRRQEKSRRNRSGTSINKNQSIKGYEKMLKKLSVTAVILAMSAMLLVPTAYAVQSVDAPAQVAL